MEKPHDLTWKHDNLKDINDAGIAGRMFNFIQKFLKLRSFIVENQSPSEVIPKEV